MDKNNKYTNMQKRVYLYGTNNHDIHNKNPLYWDLLLKDLKESDKWKNKKALDFGCGQGRNVTNMLDLCKFERVDGVDISKANIEHCQLTYSEQNSNWYNNDGITLDCIPSNEYDFVMSTIVFQHICVRDIRLSLMREIYRVMKDGGVFSFQMGYDEKFNYKTSITRGYYENFWDATSTNSRCDTRVEKPEYLTKDLEDIGFKNITYEIHKSFSDDIHVEWIYVRCEK